MLKGLGIGLGLKGAHLGLETTSPSGILNTD